MAVAIDRARSSGRSLTISSCDTTACTTADRANPSISGHRISHPMAKAMLSACQRAPTIILASLHQCLTVSRCSTGDAFVHEGKRIPPPLHIGGLEPLDPESPGRDKVVDLAVEMAATTEASPARRQAMLPALDIAIGR